MGKLLLPEFAPEQFPALVRDQRTVDFWTVLSGYLRDPYFDVLSELPPEHPVNEEIECCGVHEVVIGGLSYRFVSKHPLECALELGVAINQPFLVRLTVWHWGRGRAEYEGELLRVTPIDPKLTIIGFEQVLQNYKSLE